MVAGQRAKQGRSENDGADEDKRQTRKKRGEDGDGQRGEKKKMVPVK